MTFAYVKTRLLGGKVVPRRRCGICGGSIDYGMNHGVPCLFSCSCRKPEQSHILELGWDKLRLLVERQALGN